MPNAGPAHAGRGPQHLSVLARVHGAVRAAPAVGRGEDRRRLLRHYARAHQADPLAKRGRCSRGSAKLAVDGGGAARPRRRRCAKVPVAEKSQARGQAGEPASLSRSSKSCRRAAWMRRGRSTARALCAAAGIDCINVPDGPRASARMSAQVTCQLIQQQAGIEAVNHFCCRDRNILGIQSELLGAHAAGVRNLICITGDPPRMGTVSGRHGGVRRGRHRAGEHRQQSEPRAGYRRQSDGIADGAADRRGRESGRAEHGRGDAPLRVEGARPAPNTW